MKGGRPVMLKGPLNPQLIVGTKLTAAAPAVGAAHQFFLSPGQIRDEDAENIRTVADAVQYIDEHGG